jgi:subtilisin-like proprotein convertase family protein
MSLATAGSGALGATLTYSNATPITVSATGGTSPYPSIINVSQVPGELTSVSVTLVNVTHTNPDDLDVLLVGPQGQTVLLMSDAGGTANVSNVTLGFTETSRVFIADAGPLVAGIYGPSNYETGPDFFPNGPTAPFGNKLAVFDGDAPNGPWRLYVVDDAPLANIGGIAGGWRLTLNTTNRPPFITMPLVDQAVQEGADVTFKVGVGGTPPFGYQWLRGGAVIVPFGQGTDTLRLFGVLPTQAGTYTVMVTNGVALPAPVMDQANLVVFSPLRVTEPLPALVETQPGGVVTLHVSVTGTPPLRYQWLRNGMVLSNQTSAALRLTEITPFDAGRYSVRIWNDFEAVRSGPTLLRVNFETSQDSPQDLFERRPKLSDPDGVVRGDSSQARAETGEPLLRGGGKTMWLELTPKEAGVMTVRTRGSSFDTMLSVFRGTDLRALSVVTQDDDLGGFYTSELKFNARANEPYQIQVDGFGRGGSGGPFTLSWNTSFRQVPIPVIVSNPAPQAVVLGNDATFRVVTENADDTYQWYFLKPPYVEPIKMEGQTRSTLVIPKPRSSDVGYYHVEVRNRFGEFALGPSVALQIGNLPLFITDKMHTMFFSMSLGGDFLPIGFGNSLFKEVPSAANSEEGDPDPCGSPYFGTLWQGLSATNNGVIQVDTTGSDINARLAVYRLTGGLDDFSAPALICDLTSASNGVPAIARFDAEEGTNYSVIIEGFEGSGNIQVTTKMGVAPPLTNALKYCLVASGGSLLLSMPATAWCPPPSCQWRLDGEDIPGATSPTYLVSAFDISKVGTYSVFVSNFVTSTARDVAYLNLAPAFELHADWVTGAPTRYLITVSNATPFVIETTTALGTSWTPIATNPDPCLILRYTNNTPLSDPRRFYRAVPWSP